MECRILIQFSGFAKAARAKTEKDNQTEPLSISNENFSFKSDEIPSKTPTVTPKSGHNEKSSGKDTTQTKSEMIIDKDELERKLQSPVENHFALTPVITSESSSPANGFTSQECTDLLQDELDRLVIHEEVRDAKENLGLELSLKSSVSVEGLVSPLDENISMFTRDREGENKEDKEKPAEESNDKCDLSDIVAEVRAEYYCFFLSSLKIDTNCIVYRFFSYFNIRLRAIKVLF